MYIYYYQTEQLHQCLANFATDLMQMRLSLCLSNLSKNVSQKKLSTKKKKKKKKIVQGFY